MAALLLALAPAACFNSDELRAGGAGTESGGSDTFAGYSDETDDNGDDGWEPDDLPGDQTCRGAIMCLVTCLFQQATNEDPEPDFACFTACDEGLTQEQAYPLIRLSECIGKKCADLGECGGDAEDEVCLGCIGSNAIDPMPEGCEEEAAACQ